MSLLNRSLIITTCAFGACLMITLNACEHEPFEPIEKPSKSDTNSVDTTSIDTTTQDTTNQDTTTQDSTNIPSFSADIQPIINTNCALSGCHVSGAQFPPLTAYTEIKDKADRVKTRTGAGTMPPSGALSSENVQLIADWVDGGAPNN